MKTILITGCNGFFASRLIEKSTPYHRVIGLTRQALDITDFNAAMATLTPLKPDIIVHTAALSNTGLCQDNPDLSYHVNVTGALTIAKIASKLGAKMIHFSSDQIFNGSTVPGPHTELIAPCPNTIYATHKNTVETEIFQQLKDTIVLRLPWLFSLPELSKPLHNNLLWAIIKAALSNTAISLPYNEYRNIAYVYDLIDAMESIYTLAPGIYHVGNVNALNTYDTGCMILKKMGLAHRTEALLIKDTHRYSNHPRDLRMDISKVTQCGIPFSSTEQAIEKCLHGFGYILSTP